MFPVVRTNRSIGSQVERPFNFFVGPVYGILSEPTGTPLVFVGSHLWGSMSLSQIKTANLRSKSVAKKSRTSTDRRKVVGRGRPWDRNFLRSTGPVRILSRPRTPDTSRGSHVSLQGVRVPLLGWCFSVLEGISHIIVSCLGSVGCLPGSWIGRQGRRGSVSVSCS